MVVRIHNLTKWSVIQPGEALDLPGEELRNVVLDLRVTERTRVDVVADGGVWFLAVIEPADGVQRLEFGVTGKVELAFSTDGEVWFFTDDGDSIAYENPEAVSFTKIANRRSRNPQLEMMMFKQEQNARRREELLMAEIAAMRAAGINPETGEVDGDDTGTTGGTGGTEPGETGGAPDAAAEGIPANA